MRRTDADRMERFMTTSLGEWLVAAAIVLQVAGIFWTSRLARLQY